MVLPKLDYLFTSQEQRDNTVDDEVKEKELYKMEQGILYGTQRYIRYMASKDSKTRL